MEHPIYRVVCVEKVGAYTLRIVFDDDAVQTIYFLPVLRGALYGVLRHEALFDQVSIDPEVHTLSWPNGADFDPTMLHDWPQYADLMKDLVQKWETETVHTT
jgi:hypothetical protein